MGFFSKSTEDELRKKDDEIERTHKEIKALFKKAQDALKKFNHPPTTDPRIKGILDQRTSLIEKVKMLERERLGIALKLKTEELRKVA